MAIQISNEIIGQVFIRSFDEGIMRSMGAYPNKNDHFPSYILKVDYPDRSIREVSVFFEQPEAAFRLKRYPFISIHREDPSVALERWMGIGQLEYQAPLGNPIHINQGGKSVSGYAHYQSQIQAFPFDFNYTISCYDRYEGSAQSILQKLLKRFPPIGKLYVEDSLGGIRTYDCLLEGGITNLEELIDPVQRLRGYAISVRVLGEMDLADEVISTSVSGYQTHLIPSLKL